MMRMYLSNRKDSGYAVALTLVGNGTLPVFAFIISRMAAPLLIFLSYLLTELLVFALSMRRYRWWLAKDRKEQLDNEEEIVLHMTIRPEDAVEASRSLRAFADENGTDKRVAYRIALCMEEMVAYAKEVNKSIFPIKNKPVNAMVLELTCGTAAPNDWRIFEHNTLEMLELMLKTFRKYNYFAPDVRYYVSHMARTLHAGHSELKKELEPLGVTPAYDGLTFTI